MMTQLPGFRDPVHDAQQTFRALLAALARPGLMQTTAVLEPPDGIAIATAAASLTLFDLESTVWLQPGFPEALRDWLLFHTGCQFGRDPGTADFAVVRDLTAMPELNRFNWGTPEYPEASTSLLVQLPTLQGGEAVSLHGPGIHGEIPVELPVTAQFWAQWAALTAHYPLGVDIWFCARDRVLGLPRTAELSGGARSG